MNSASSTRVPMAMPEDGNKPAEKAPLGPLFREEERP
jgi:hypothetical protein